MKNKKLYPSLSMDDSNKKDKEVQQDLNPSESAGENQDVTMTGATVVVDAERRKNTTIGREIPSSLLLLSGPQDLIGFCWTLLNAVATVGRSRRLTDIYIPHTSLSKSHFQIVNKKDKFYIVDLKSTNKTKKNDEVLEPYKEYLLEDNDKISAAEITFKFLSKGNVEILSSRTVFKKTQTDSLTGANNRQSLDLRAPEFFSLYDTFSILVFDVDKFKSINDTHGHLAGDYILKTIVHLIKKVIRDNDMIFRYGGDEFCVLTPYSLQVASSMAKRINEKIENYSFNFEGQELKTSLSIGFSEKDKEDKTWEDLYKRADEMCYQVKKSKK